MRLHKIKIHLLAASNEYQLKSKRFGNYTFIEGEIGQKFNSRIHFSSWDCQMQPKRDTVEFDFDPDLQPHFLKCEGRTS
jgi:hypothetical protein